MDVWVQNKRNRRHETGAIEDTKLELELSCLRHFTEKDHVNKNKQKENRTDYIKVSTAERITRNIAMAVQLYDVKYKVLLLGDAGVGKTSLIRKLMGQEMQNNYMCTIGKIETEFISMTLNLFMDENNSCLFYWEITRDF